MKTSKLTNLWKRTISRANAAPSGPKDLNDYAGEIFPLALGFHINETGTYKIYGNGLPDNGVDMYYVAGTTERFDVINIKTSAGGTVDANKITLLY